LERRLRHPHPAPTRHRCAPPQRRDNLMRFNQSTDFALRVLMYLGLKGSELATIGEIAEVYGISRNHLMKVIYRLGQAEFVHTQRGKGGGLRLARAPAEISVGDVVRRM